MKREAYRALMAVNPRGRKQTVNAFGGAFGSSALRDEALAIYRKYHVLGASLILFDRQGVTGRLYTGTGGAMGEIGPGTYYRVASVSKMVSAALFLHASLRSPCSPDEDLERVFGLHFRNPGYPDMPITPRMLLSHTSSLLDGSVMETGAAEKWPLERVVSRAVFADERPGESFHYSNLGAALCGEALRLKTGKPLDELLTEAFGVPGTYDAALLPAAVSLADGVDMLTGRTAFSAACRRAAGVGTVPDWCRAHGNLCLTAEDLAAIARTLMTDETYESMKRPVIAFGARDPAIKSGLGMFIMQRKSDPTVFGHQGLAYGACHGVFFDGDKGFVFLTSGCSLSRRYVLSDLNLALINRFIGGGSFYENNC